MGFFDSIFGSKSQPVNVDQAMNALEDEDVDVIHGPAEYYVKPISLDSDVDLDVVQTELGSKNVVLLSVSAASRNPAKLKEQLSRLSGFAQSINGDIARISEDKILITPSNMKIAKNSKKA